MKDKREYFQVGDKVKVLYKNNTFFGEIGTVVRVVKAKVYVKFGYRVIAWGKVSSLEVVKRVWSVA